MASSSGLPLDRDAFALRFAVLPAFAAGAYFPFYGWTYGSDGAGREHLRWVAEGDPDLASLRDWPEFKRLLARYASEVLPPRKP